MSPAHALELLLHPDDEAAARQEWAALEQAGVPSLARHRGSTHRPHLTVVTGRAPDEDVLDLAARLLLPLLPLTTVVEGQVLLGGRSPALAHRLRVPLGLQEARDLLADRWPGADRRPWVPHLSLTRRTRHDHLVAALGALTPGTHEGSVRLVAARWWDPDAGTVTVLERPPAVPVTGAAPDHLPGRAAGAPPARTGRTTAATTART